MANGEIDKPQHDAPGSSRELSRRQFLKSASLAALLAGGGGTLLLQACTSAEPGATTTTLGGLTTTTGVGQTSTTLAAGTIAPGGVLRVAMGGEPDLLDPARSALAASQEVWHHIFGRLVRIAPDEEILPDLARSWEVEGDRVWVFDLEEDVTFHNGDSFTADDVKYSFDRLFDPETASPWVDKFPEVEEVEVRSPYQVAFHLAEPYAPFLISLALNGQVVNRRSIEEGDPERMPVGTGPFRLTEWVQTDHLTLERNEEYFKQDQLTYLDSAEMRFVEIAPQQVLSLRSGDLDYMDSVPRQSVAELEGDGEIKLLNSETAGKPQVIAFNTTAPPFDNKAFRQAIAWSVDRNVIRDVALFGTGEVGSQEVPSASRWYSANDPFQEGPDLDRTRQLLEESGVELPIEIEFLAWTTEQYPTRVGELLRDQLRPLGVNINIQQTEIGQWVPRLLGREYQMTVAFNEGTVDPDNIYSLFLKSGSGLNFTGYENPEFDALVDEARAELDPDRRIDLYAQLREMIFDDVPLFFYHYDTVYYAMRPEVLGATARPSLELGLEFVGFAAAS